MFITLRIHVLGKSIQVHNVFLKVTRYYVKNLGNIPTLNETIWTLERADNPKYVTKLGSITTLNKTIWTSEKTISQVVYGARIKSPRETCGY